jgi:hypothetical protein
MNIMRKIEIGTTYYRQRKVAGCWTPDFFVQGPMRWFVEYTVPAEKHSTLHTCLKSSFYRWIKQQAAIAREKRQSPLERLHASRTEKGIP